MANSLPPDHHAHILQARSGRLPDASRLRFAFTVCAILVFTLQSYVLQAHIHHAGGAAIAETVAPHAHHQTPSGRDDGGDCPLCQAFALAGTFVPPVSAPLPLPLLQLWAAWAPTEAPSQGKTAQFSWRSRAPPVG